MSLCGRAGGRGLVVGKVEERKFGLALYRPCFGRSDDGSGGSGQDPVKIISSTQKRRNAETAHTQITDIQT